MTKRRRRENLWRGSSRHAWRGRKRWQGDRYEWNLTADLREGQAAQASRIIESTIESGGVLSVITVTVKIGAKAMTVPVRIKKNGKWIDEEIATPALPAMTVDEALTKFADLLASTPRAGRHRKGPGNTKADAASDRARATMIACWWIPERGGFRLGSLPVGELRADHLQQVMRDQMLAGRPGSTRNKYALFLKGFAAWLTASDIASRPLTLDVESFRRDSENRRTRRLSVDEYDRLVKTCSPWLRALVEAALETGCRRGELLGLRWGMVDLDKGTIRLPASLTKTSEARQIPISPPFSAILKMRRLDPAGEEFPETAFVFGTEIGGQVKSTKTCWRSATRRAGLADLHFHDLRREAASRLLEGGLALHYVSKLLGHRNIATTSTYLSATSEDLHRAFCAVKNQKVEEERPAPTPPPSASASVTVN
jgi:integrase